MTETFYDVLGVDEDATTAEIQSAYRERLKQTHPDVSDDDDAGERTQSLIEARDVLTDDEERARYDRVGHDSYVGGGSVDSPSEAASDVVDSGGAAETDSGPGGPNRSRRERRASQRVSEERADDSETTATEEPTETNGHDPEPTAGGQWRDDMDGPYSVRQTVATERSYWELLPSGRDATLLGIVFALYPVLLFSALIPAFPLFVNLIIAGCALLLVGYLQSMPSVALLVFGSWSLLTPLVLLALNVSAFSLLGFAALCGTWLPFGFSVLTASVLRL